MQSAQAFRSLRPQPETLPVGTVTGGSVRGDVLLAPVEEPAEVEEVQIEDDFDEEVAPATSLMNPKQPTAGQLAKHREYHLPYRSWCKWCVMGRGRGLPHKHQHRSSVPRVGVDYFYITSGGVRRKEELSEDINDTAEGAIESARQRGEIVKCIIVRCWDSKCIFAHVIPCKGLDEDSYVSNLVTEDIAWLGYNSMVLKADNETSVQKLVRK